MLTGTRKQKLIQTLQNEDTLATVLIAVIIDLYGAEVLNYEQITLDLQLKDDLGVELPKINRDKIQAMTLAMTSDQVQTDWLVFNQVCEALNNDPVNLEILDPITPEQAAWGLTELALVEEGFEPDEEVRRYLGAILVRSGLNRKNGILAIAILPDSDYSDTPMSDPEMQTAVFAKEQSDLDYINEYVVERVKLLFQQLDEAPLEDRDDESWKAFQNRVSQKLA